MNVPQFKTFVDVIHQTMRMEYQLCQIIDTPEFQRLRRIKQLGSGYRVFHCATHTRFEHSIGVAYVCGKLITGIKNRQPELHISDRDVLLVKAAGLLHDIGHACFSHFFDDYFLKTTLLGTENEKWIKHEFRSEKILRHIINKYEFQFTTDEIDFICEMINPKSRPKRLPSTRTIRSDYFYQIVSNYINGFDGDKIDYLLRDNFFVGTKTSYRYEHLFEEARVIDNIICFAKNDALNVYGLYQLRYTMHKKYYTDKTINIFDFMILDILKLVDSEFQISANITNLDVFCTYTDDLLERIKYSSNNQQALNLIHRIETRDLYIFVDEIVHNGKNESLIQKITEITAFCTKHNVQEQLITSHFNINFNMKNKNPVDAIHFYDINNPSIKFNIDRKKISLLLPAVFEEFVTRVIIKTNPVIEGKTLKEHLKLIMNS